MKVLISIFAFALLAPLVNAQEAVTNPISDALSEEMHVEDLAKYIQMCSEPAGTCAQPETSWPASQMASPLFVATPVPFGKRSASLATITADQFWGLRNQGFHGSLPDTARAVGRLCPRWPPQTPEMVDR
jgi:hypothetical protein